MRKILLVILAVTICVSFAGCGETISAVGKDVGRMGKGINTFFFRQP